MSGFDKIIGFDSIKSELIKFCDVLRNSDKYKEIGVSLPSGLMFCGEPGVGKTLLAECFIEETGYKSYIIRKDKPDGDFTNYIRDIFEKAGKEGRAIVLLDDMDKFANEESWLPDAEEYVTVQTCIDHCKGKGVFVLATVNNKNNLPKSLLRAGRFDKIIEISAPEYEDVIKLIRYYLGLKKTADDIEVSEVARIITGMPVSDIKCMLNEAGINAGYEGRSRIEWNDIIQAIKRMLFEGPECSSKNKEDYEKIIIHELGHVVVGEVLKPGCVSLVSVESYDGGVDGVTIFCNDHLDKEGYSKVNMENLAVRILSGRAATEIIYGEPDMGAYDDICKAYRIIKDIYTEQSLNGFEFFRRLGNEEGVLKEKQEVVIAFELNQCYQRAKVIIAENRNLLLSLAEILKKEKTLTYGRIHELIDKFKYSQVA